MNQRIETANIYLTEQCNLRCDYCYETHQDMVMSSLVMDKVIEYCLDNCKQDEFKFWLFGGEPLLESSRILTFIQKAKYACRERKIKPRFNVLTNGTIFNENLAEFWQTHGCVAMQISLDGIGEAHDRHRKTCSGQPTFELIKGNIQKYLGFREDLHIRLTVMPDTAHLLAQSIRTILDMGIRSFAIMPVHEVEWTNEAVKAYREGFKNVVDMIVSLIQKGESVFCSNLRLNYPGEYFQEIPCGAGDVFAAITTDGSIYPCHRFVYLNDRGKSFKLGDVFSGIDEEKQKPFKNITIDQMKGCADCGVKNCNRCIAMNYLMNKNMMDSGRLGYCALPGIHDEAAIKVYNYLTEFYNWANETNQLQDFPFVKNLIEKNDYCFHVN